MVDHIQLGTVLEIWDLLHQKFRADILFPNNSMILLQTSKQFSLS